MEKASEYVNKNDENNTSALATQIGREFVRQYYTKWSFQLNEVFQFYGNESVFLHDDKEAKGQEAIQKMIEKLNYNDCKARIHSVTGVYGANESLVLQVCGELSIDQGLPRRFLQHFVLCKQQAKKYYVQYDIFQWLNKSFCDVTLSRNEVDGLGNDKKELLADTNSNHITLSTHQNGHSLTQKTVSALNDMTSLTKIVTGSGDNAKERVSTANVEPPETLNNNGPSKYLSPVKSAPPQQPTNSTAQLLQQQQLPSAQQTTAASLSDGLQQQQPPKQMPQQQHRSYNSAQQRYSQRQPYSQQQHNSHFQSLQSNAPPTQQNQQQHQTYRHQLQPAPPQSQHQLQQLVKRQDSHPKTWAKAVSNNSLSTGLTNQSGGIPNNNGGNNNYGGGNHHHNVQQHQQFRPSFGGSGNGASHQRKQFQQKMHK